MFQLVVINVLCNSVDEGTFKIKSGPLIKKHTCINGKLMTIISFDQK